MTSWLDLPPDDDTPLATADQLAFVQQVRELFDAAGAPGLDRENADAGIWRELLDGALLIVLPLTSASHACIQLQMTSQMILGAWEDKHYIWDNTRDGEEELRINGTDAPARSLALAWLDHEIRRPFVRRDTRWGLLHATTWTHTDNESAWVESTGFLPIQPPGTGHTQMPAGYLDPPQP